MSPPLQLCHTLLKLGPSTLPGTIHNKVMEITTTLARMVTCPLTISTTLISPLERRTELSLTLRLCRRNNLCPTNNHSLPSIIRIPLKAESRKALVSSRPLNQHISPNLPITTPHIKGHILHMSTL